MTSFLGKTRSALLALCLSLASLNCANALDFAHRNIIGFSEDGTKFAFEQYGIQDGSGFPYSEIFMINTLTDEWFAKPVRVLLKNEAASLNAAREKAKALAASNLEDITHTPIIAATQQADETTKDPYHLSISPRSFFLPNNQTRMDFLMEPLQLETSERCKSYGVETQGFKLMRTKADGTVKIMHEDTSVPESRNCPLDYFPSDIIIHITPKGRFILAVMVRMQTLGFEGADRRYLAVTSPLD